MTWGSEWETDAEHKKKMILMGLIKCYGCLLILLTELEEEGGNTAAHPRQDAAHSRACVPQHSGEELRGVDVHQGGASSHGKLPHHL